jgi:hypothetical protein
MNAYCLCRHCARHIKRDEAACPFCGEARLVGLSRRGAQWLVYGSALTVLGCTTSAPARPPQSQDATTASEVDARAADDTAVLGVADQGEATADQVEATTDQVEATTDQVEATTEDAAADAAGPMLTPADGSFPCSWLYSGGPWDGATCDRATQYCFLQGGIGYSPDGCRSFACGPVMLTAIPGGFAPSDGGCGPIEWACDGGVRRCSCLTTPCSARTCTDDDAGAVVLSCGQCYGAPPRVGRDARALTSRVRRVRPSRYRTSRSASLQV